MPEAVEITAEDAIARVDAGGWLLDVREPAEWNDVHTPSAHLVPMGELMDRIDEIPDDARIVVICHSGYRSRLVTKALVQAGYDAVNVAGGMDAWESAGGAVVRPGLGGDEA